MAALPPVLRITLLTIGMLTAIPARSVAQSVTPPAALPQATYVDQETIQEALRSGQYVEVPADQLPGLLQRTVTPADRPIPVIRRAHYTARLIGESLVDGAVTLELVQDRLSESLVLGRTTLQELQFERSGQPLALAALPDGQLALPSEGLPNVLQGTWSATGLPGDHGTRFDLQLPSSAVTELELTTTSEIRVTSPSAIVSSERDGNTRRWTLIPRGTQTLTMVCASADQMRQQEQQAVLAIDTTFTIDRQSAFADWTMSVPAELNDATLVVSVPPDCHIAEIVNSTGRPVPWQQTADTKHQLTIPQLRQGQTLRIRGSLTQTAKGPLSLPLLNQVVWLRPDSDSEAVAAPVRLRSSGIRLTVPAFLAVRELTTEGLYQTEVSLNSDGDQVIELNQVTQDAQLAISAVPAVASIQQEMLIHRPAEPAGVATVYVQMTPYSDQVYELNWTMSGHWRPSAIRDLNSGQSVSFSQRQRARDGQESLLVDLPAAASPGQPARLQMEFRSTHAVTPETLSLPDIRNPRYQSDGTWILSASEFRHPAAVPLADQQGFLRDFSWLPEDLPEPDQQYLTHIGHDSGTFDTSPVNETAAARTLVNYRIHATTDRIHEEIAVRLSSERQLPGTILVLFPEGLDEVRLAGRTNDIRLVPTGHRSRSGWREWLLTLPARQREENSCLVQLEVSRPLASAEHAAIPRFPQASQVTIMARNIAGGRRPSARVALIDEQTDDDVARSVPLQPGISIYLPASTARRQLHITPQEQSRTFLAIRGTVRCLMPSRPDSQQAQCLAELVVSRTGPANSIRIHWPEASEIQTCIDDRPVWSPVRDSVSEIHLPPDRPTIRLQVRWNTPLEAFGWLNQIVRMRLPEVESSDILDVTCDVLVSQSHQLTGDLPMIQTKLLAAAPQQPPEETPTADPAADFNARWNLTASHQASRVLCQAPDGILTIRVVSRRLLWATTLLMFCGTVYLGPLIASRPLRDQLLLLSTGTLAAFAATSPLSWWISAWNIGLSLLLLKRTALWLKARTYSRSPALPDRTSDSTASSIITALLAILLTGQSPLPPDLPAVLLPEGAPQTTTHYVRRDLLPDDYNNTGSPTNVRVADIEAEVRLESPGGAEVSIQATLACRPGPQPALFALPLESANPISCSLNGHDVPLVRDDQGRPVVRIHDGTTDSTAADESWQQHQLTYTIRTDAAEMASQLNLHLPLPASVRTRISVLPAAKEDQILTVRLAESGQTPWPPDDEGRISLPPLYNRSAVDLIIETQTSGSSSVAPLCAMGLACLLEPGQDLTQITCRYQVTSSPAPPRQLMLPLATGFRMNSAQSADGRPLSVQLMDDGLTLTAESDELSDFELVWTAPRRFVSTEQLLPANLLTLPSRCTAEQILLAVRLPALMEADRVSRGETQLTDISMAEEQYVALGLQPSDDVYDVPLDNDDVNVSWKLKPNRRTASISQELQVGVRQLNWSCQFELNAQGPPCFRQAIRVPPDLLIDRVSVTAGGTPRLRSWSCQKGWLLVSFLEATRGRYRLTFHGTRSIPANGQVKFHPTIPENTIVTDCTLLLSSREGATVRLMSAAGMAGNSRIAESGEPLRTVPRQLAISDLNQPVVLQTRTQDSTTAEFVILQRSTAGGLPTHAALRIRAGDQGWIGQFRVPENLTFDDALWIQGTNSTQLPFDSEESETHQLQPGEVATLQLSGLQAQVRGTTAWLPLPKAEPAIDAPEIHVFEVAPNAVGTEGQILQRLPEDLTNGENSGLLTDLSRAAEYDAGSHTVRISGIEAESGTVSSQVVRQAEQSFSVTHLYAAGQLLCGTTHILIDFGEARDNQLIIPEGTRITRCQLDGVDLPRTSTDARIIMSRRRRLQQLVVDWSMPLSQPGYLTTDSSFALPSVQATQQQRYLILQAPREQMWRGTAPLKSITMSQLTTEIPNAFMLSSDISPDSGGRPFAESLTADQQQQQRQQSVDNFLQFVRTRVVSHTRLYQLPGDESNEARLQLRQKLSWLHWLPLLALSTVGLVTIGRHLPIPLRQPLRPGEALTTEILPGASDSDSGYGSTIPLFPDEETADPGEGSHTDGSHS